MRSRVYNHPMIYLIATDHCKYTIASDGAITGVAALGPGQPWDTKLGIQVAVLRMYVGWQGGDPLPLKGYSHYYLASVNMAVGTELVARACSQYGAAGCKNQAWIAWKYARALPVEIMAYERSYRDILKALKDQTGFEFDFAA